MAKAKVDTGKMPEKIIAMAQNDLSTIVNLHNSTDIAPILSTAATKTIIKYFGDYYDNLARTEKYLYQHVYEFGQAGNKQARLFKPSIKAANANGNIVEFNFINAQIPNNNGYKFAKKASVMEFGIPVTIKPRKSDVLVFENDGETVFTKNNITIQNPGGNVAGNFNSALQRFMNSEGQMVLSSTGFNKKVIFNLNIQHDLSSRKIQSGTLNGISLGRNAAKNIAVSMAVIAND